MEHKDDDDDDDVSFAKWMSSFWGHSWIEENERRLRDFRGSQDASCRKTSLPSPFPEGYPVDDVKLIFTVSRRTTILPVVKFPMLPRVITSDSHPRRHSHEDQGFRCCNHMRDYKKRSEDGSFKEPLKSKRRSHPQIQTFSESFEQQLCFRTKRSVSLGPESRKERNERECLQMEIRSCQKVEERKSSKKEEHEEAYTAPLFEKGPK